MLLGAVAVLAPASARGDALTPLRAEVLPAPPVGTDGAAPMLVSLGRTLVAFDADGGAHTLAAGGSAWQAARWAGAEAPPRIVGAFGDNTRAFVLLGDDGAGRDTTVALADVALDGDALARRPLPPLPLALSATRATLRNGIVSVAGSDAGNAARLYRIDTSATPPAWTTLPVWPGAAPATSLAAQGSGLYASVADAGHESIWGWTADTGWIARTQVPGRVLAGSGHAIGQAHVLYLLQGADGGAVAATFQTITGSWATLPGAVPDSPLASLPWPDGVAWLARDAAGATQLVAAQVQARKHLLSVLDWTVIAVYLFGMIGIGLYFYLRQTRGSTDDFFVGGRTIPFWAAGISLYATNVSSISFIAIPAKAFETNWQYLSNNLMAVLGLMFVAIWIVPVLRRLDLMSVFSYLELRFHPGIRMIASALCVLTQIGARMSVILFLPSLAIATITGLDVVWSILLMGGFTILYTTLGGMKAVIWTDFAQVFVMFGGALFAVAFIVFNLDGGAVQFVDTALAQDKLRLFDFSFDLTKATIWGFVFLVLFDVVLTFPKDQVLMQRVLSTRSDREAGRSVWMFAAIMIPGGVLFYLIGTALFVYYQSNPERMNPLLPIDATFPLFIAAELPRGVTGIIIAGIFAAAMSTLSSIINSVSTMLSVDFFQRIGRRRSERSAVIFAEWSGVMVGLFGIGVALLLSRYDIHSLLDTSIQLFGVLGGGFAGAYTLGMFTRRANAPGVAIGIGSSLCLTLIAWAVDLVHPYFYLAISILLCIVIGYLASLLFPAPTRSLAGLTIYRDLPASAPRAAGTD
nr:sodium:solute symporter [Chiayiivirga flava]